MAGDETFDSTEYIEARRVLLDAIVALEAHHDKLTLVGAQAIYLQIGEADIAVDPYTTDGDLMIDPRGLADQPAIAVALAGAGFGLTLKPGTWSPSSGVKIDLLVPSVLGGEGRRGARLGSHGNEVARKVDGLEAALVDRVVLRVSALEPENDPREFDLQVAGPTALLLAKLCKIHERSDDPARRKDKDALDVLRLLRATEIDTFVETLAELLVDVHARSLVERGRGYLEQLFGSREALGTQMAVRAVGRLADPVGIAMSCELLARELVGRWPTRA